jgi:hypothetical protein
VKPFLLSSQTVLPFKRNLCRYVKTKQGAAMDAQTEKIYDQIYLENYLAAARVEDAEVGLYQSNPVDP